MQYLLERSKFRLASAKRSRGFEVEDSKFDNCIAAEKSASCPLKPMSSTG